MFEADWGPISNRVPREMIGNIIAITDILIMISFLIFIWLHNYYVRADSERHRKLLFET